MITQDDLQGHWRRKWIRAPGFEDVTTRVHWMQCGALFADLRIPSERPDLTGARCLADLDAPALRVLMTAEGFAGAITVEGSVCTWHRTINWHGVPDGVDAGRMSFDAAGDLIEDGVHADYAELWQKMPETPGDAWQVTGDGMQGVLVSSASEFLIGLGEPDAAPTAPLIAALERGDRPEELNVHFRGVYVLGRWEAGQGIATLSTNPFLEGTQVLERNPDGVVFRGADFDGRDQVFSLIPSIPSA